MVLKCSSTGTHFLKMALYLDLPSFETKKGFILSAAQASIFILLTKGGISFRSIYCTPHLSDQDIDSGSNIIPLHLVHYTRAEA